MGRRYAYMLIATCAYLLISTASSWSIPGRLPIKRQTTPSLGTISPSSAATLPPSFFNSLNVPKWLQTFQTITPVCATTTSDKCCVQGEPWANCFLRIYSGNSGSVDCTTINPEDSQRCFEFSQKVLDYKLKANASDSLSIIALTTSISGINLVFNRWQALIPALLTQVTSPAASLARTFDPHGQGNIPLTDVVGALLAYPIYAPVGDAEVNLTASLQYGTKAVADAIFPQFADKSAVMTLQGFANPATTGAIQFLASQRLEAGLKVVMSDIGAFSAFAANGSWMAAGYSNTADLGDPQTPEFSERSLFPLSLLLFSSALNFGDHVMRIQNVDQPPRGACQPDLVCASSNPQSIYSSLTKNSYTFGHKRDAKYMTTVHDVLYASFGGLNPGVFAQMLDGAFTCASLGIWEAGPIQIGEGYYNQGCLSRAQECVLYEVDVQTPCPCALININGGLKCPFEGCPNR